MNIAFLVTSFPTLSETFILDQMKALLDNGHSVQIFTSNLIRQPQNHLDVEKYRLLSRAFSIPSSPLLRNAQGIRLIALSLPKNPIAILKSLNLFKYRKEATNLNILYLAAFILQNEPFDIIVCNFGWEGRKGILLKDLGVTDAKIVTFFHGADISREIQKYGPNLYNKLFAQGDLIIAVSDLIHQTLLKLGSNPNRTIVHRMGIDINQLSPELKKLRSENKARILSVARLEEKKGIEYGILAVAKLLDLGYDIEYLIAGEGTLRENLQNLIDDLAINEKVKLLGWKTREDITALRYNTDIFLSPSVTSADGDKEGIPVAIMEAMAIGLPILSTVHSGIPELVKNGESGFLVPEKNVEALAERLQYLIDHPEISETLGREGRRFVEEHHNLDKLNVELIQTYSKL
ncbi:MAG: glycosyltransferase [Aphanocapsa sp. GSE-SYN-MK-11-07L]|jgi:colanic acid/amylovoran biosynthesis glycosyltransferase|nr:glycosyltransferase [Aphanocapsa sp. GSE-SYN-MK-11-07L]